MRALFLSFIFVVTACATQTSTARSTQDPVRLSDVLAEYKILNTRLESIAAPLLRANTDLCRRTARDIGITTHTLSDYPEGLQDAARELMSVSDSLSIRSVRLGSPADKAGLKAGDHITTVGPFPLKGQAKTQDNYTLLSQKAFENTKSNIEILRGSKLIQFSVTPETICGYPVHVYFNDTLNGHTDGNEVFITSELLRRVPADVNVALIVAHELAHAIAGHIDQTPSKTLELKADRMALILMARAGYDIDQAVSYWKDVPHPYKQSTSTHPSTRERYENFLEAKTDIQTKQRIGLALTF